MKSDRTINLAICAIILSLSGLAFTAIGARGEKPTNQLVFDIEAEDLGLAPSWQDSVSRDPVWLISAFSGNRSPENPAGLAPWWNDAGAVGELLDRIQEGYALGARRFFINRPMGTDGTSHISGASWLTIDREKRGEIVDALAQTLLDRYPERVDLIWFVGSDLRDPRDLKGWHDSGSDDYYQIGDTSQIDRLYASRFTLGGWISTGADGIAIDHSSPPDERDHFIDLANALRSAPFHITIYGEALPLVTLSDGRVARNKAGVPMVDLDALHSMSWIATDTYLDDRWPDRGGDRSLNVDRRFSRVFKWFTGRIADRTDIEARDAAQLAIRQGFIPITNDPRIFSTALDIQRLIDEATAKE